METLPVFVGLDYHQSFVQVCVLDRAGAVLANRRCDNDPVPIAQLVGGFGPVSAVAIEACTGSADLAERLIDVARWSVHLAHPGYVARMKRGPDKSDFTDARMLADLVRVGYLPEVWLAPEHIRELRKLVGYRRQLAEQRRNTKLRIGALARERRVRSDLPRGGRPWLRSLARSEALGEQSRWIADRHLTRLLELEREIKAVESRLTTLTREDPVVQRLVALRGIGPVTAWALRANVGRFERFANGKQLARFCGLSPRNASSGQRQADAGLVKAGDRYLRATLIEAAHRLIWYDERWKALAARLESRGKPRSVTVAAVANRWVRWLHHEMTAGWSRPASA